MKKLNLYLISGNKEKTLSHFKKINKLIKLEKKGKMINSTTLDLHYFIISKYFNLKNFFDFTIKEIITDKNAIVYHLPNGKDEFTNVEKNLSKLKGKTPIVFRSYDPHSPLKTSKEYMLKYHDLCLTYIKERVDNKKIIFKNLCYDNHLIYKKNKNTKKRKDICMILRNRVGKEYRVSKEEFKKKGLNLEKKYDDRHKIVENKKVDIFGTGWSKKIPNYKGMLYPHERKYDILEEYNFSIIIENAIVNSLISEKFLDSILCENIPIYNGPNDVEKIIPTDCFINLKENKNYDITITKALKLSKENRTKIREKIIQNKKEILKKFSTKENFVKPVYNWYNKKYMTKFGPKEKDIKSIEKNIKKLKFIRKSILISKFLEKIKYYLS